MNIDNALANKDNNFDTIRFLAAIAVIYSHSFPLTGAIEPPVKFVQNTYGGLGVSIFLIISGFLVTHSWFRSENLMSFLKSRILRIFPGLIVVLLISSFIVGPLTTTLSLSEYFRSMQTYTYLKMATLYDVEYNLPGVFINNPYSGTINGSLWTLEYEFTFYILLGVLGAVKFLRNKSVVVLIFSAALTLSVLNAFPDSGIYTLYATYFNKFLSYFSVGMIYYVFREYIPLNKSFAYICIFILFLSTFFGGLSHGMFILFGSYLLFYVALAPNIRLFKASRFGDFSYGLYIYAFPSQQLLIWLNDGKMEPLTNFVLSFLLALFCSILSWHLVEKRFLKLKNYSLINMICRKKIASYKVLSKS